MSDISEYTGTFGKISVIVRDGEPWFFASELAELFKYSSPSAAIRQVPEADRERHIVDTAGGRQRVAIVNEAGFYTVALGSKLPEAIRLRTWVTREVLPALRRGGIYGLDRISRGDLARMIIEAENELTAARGELAATRPAAGAWTAVASELGSWTIGWSARILSRDPGITITSDQLKILLYQVGFTNWDSNRKVWVANPPAVKAGRINEGVRPDGKPLLRLTHEGLAILHAHLGGRELLHVDETIPEGIAA